MNEKLYKCVSFIYLDGIIMVYSHRTRELADLEVENVMNIDILIVVSSITVSKDCCLLLWYFQPTELLSTCRTFVTQWCKKKRINESGNRLITIMQICNAGFIAQTSTDALILILWTMTVLTGKWKCQQLYCESVSWHNPQILWLSHKPAFVQ